MGRYGDRRKRPISHSRHRTDIERVLCSCVLVGAMCKRRTRNAYHSDSLDPPAGLDQKERGKGKTSLIHVFGLEPADLGAE